MQHLAVGDRVGLAPVPDLLADLLDYLFIAHQALVHFGDVLFEEGSVGQTLLIRERRSLIQQQLRTASQ